MFEIDKILLFLYNNVNKFIKSLNNNRVYIYVLDSRTLDLKIRAFFLRSIHLSFFSSTIMVRVIPNKPLLISLACVAAWLLIALFVVIPVHVSTILLSVCLVYIGSYVSIFTKKV